MSSQVIRRLPFLVCSLTAGLLLAGAARAQDPKDPLLNDVAQRKVVEAQKFEKEIKESLDNASLIAKADGPEAAKLLKLVREQVADDTNLSPERRKSLLATIDARIKSSNERPAPTTTVPVERPSTKAREDERRAQEADRVKDIAKILNSRKDGIADHQRISNQKSEAFEKVGAAVVKSSIPTVNDVDFPSDWVERTKKRSEVKMTETEVKLMKALNTPLRDLDFDKTKLQEFLQYIQDKTGQSLLIPKAVMDEVGISYETGVTLKADNVTLRTVLKKVLGDLNLTYIVKDEHIQVTTPERAKQTYSIRAYYVGDLAGVVDQRLPLVYKQAAMAQTIALIMTNVVQMVDPKSWQANNPEAGGTIVFDPLTMSIIVKQTAEVHFMLGVGMRR